MINIFLHNKYNKFINNIFEIKSDQYKLIKSDNTQQIYKYHYTQNINTYIFCASSVDQQILDFIGDQNKNFESKYIIYHDVLNSSLIDSTLKIKHLINEKDAGQIQNKTVKVLPSAILNENLYDTSNSINFNSRSDIIIVFLENKDTIPDSIVKHLYPNSNKRILLFNTNYVHDQNLGFVEEKDKPNLLKTSKYFWCDETDYYLLEAQKCGCLIIRDLDNITQDNTPSENNYITYKQFLMDLINET